MNILAQNAEKSSSQFWKISMGELIDLYEKGYISVPFYVLGITRISRAPGWNLKFKSVSDFCKAWGIKSRQSFYTAINKLKKDGLVNYDFNGGGVLWYSNESPYTYESSIKESQDNSNRHLPTYDERSNNTQDNLNRQGVQSCGQGVQNNGQGVQNNGQGVQNNGLLSPESLVTIESCSSTDILQISSTNLYTDAVTDSALAFGNPATHPTTATATCTNQNDEDLSLESKILKNQEQALEQDLDPHEKTISQNSETHHIVNSPEVYSTNEKTTLEDQKSAAARREVVMTSTCNKLISVILENGGITQNSGLTRYLLTYSLEQVAGAIAHLEASDQLKRDRGDAPIKNREGYLRSALEGDWIEELLEREGIRQEDKTKWLTGHTALLLDIAVDFNVEENSLVVNVRDRGSLPLDVFVESVQQQGWAAVLKQYQEFRDSSKNK